MSKNTFDRGQAVVWRSLPGGNVGTVMPVTIVCDDGDIIGLFQQSGSVRKRRTGNRGGPGDMILDVTVAHDLSSWDLKDGHELDWAEEHGIVSTEEADQARSEAKIIGNNIGRCAWPFFDELY